MTSRGSSRQSRACSESDHRGAAIERGAPVSKPRGGRSLDLAANTLAKFVSDSARRISATLRTLDRRSSRSRLSSDVHSLY